MRIISRKRLREFWEQPRYSDAEGPLKAWFQEAKRAEWKDSHGIKEMYGSASFLTDNRVVFNIAGNKYRLVVKVTYPYRVVYIRFVGTHGQYDDIDVTEV